jgi:hypothetical protein
MDCFVAPLLAMTNKDHPILSAAFPVVPDAATAADRAHANLAIPGFSIYCLTPTSRVELTLNANLLPGKVASSRGEMRPIRQPTG